MRHSSRPSNSRAQLSRHSRIASPRPPFWPRRNAAMLSSHLRSRPSATPTCGHALTTLIENARLDAWQSDAGCHNAAESSQAPWYGHSQAEN